MIYSTVKAVGRIAQERETEREREGRKNTKKPYYVFSKNKKYEKEKTNMVLGSRQRRQSRRYTGQWQRRIQAWRMRTNATWIKIALRSRKASVGNIPMPCHAITRISHRTKTPSIGSLHHPAKPSRDQKIRSRRFPRAVASYLCMCMWIWIYGVGRSLSRETFLRDRQDRHPSFFAACPSDQEPVLRNANEPTKHKARDCG